MFEREKMVGEKKKSSWKNSAILTFFKFWKDNFECINNYYLRYNIFYMQLKPKNCAQLRKYILIFPRVIDT